MWSIISGMALISGIENDVDDKPEVEKGNDCG
jgi:hypothetical protein